MNRIERIAKNLVSVTTTRDMRNFLKLEMNKAAVTARALLIKTLIPRFCRAIPTSVYTMKREDAKVSMQSDPELSYDKPFAVASIVWKGRVEVLVSFQTRYIDSVDVTAEVKLDGRTLRHVRGDVPEQIGKAVQEVIYQELNLGFTPPAQHDDIVKDL